jgi:hypothetical protein
VRNPARAAIAVSELSGISESVRFCLSCESKNFTRRLQKHTTRLLDLQERVQRQERVESNEFSVKRAGALLILYRVRNPIFTGPGGGINPASYVTLVCVILDTVRKKESMSGFVLLSN